MNSWMCSLNSHFFGVEEKMNMRAFGSLVVVVKGHGWMEGEDQNSNSRKTAFGRVYCITLGRNG